LALRTPLSNADTGGHIYDLLSTGSANTGGSGRLDFFDRTAGLARLSITSAGNVGVGTTWPFSTFSVTGSAYLTGALNVGDSITTRNNLGLGYAGAASIINQSHIAAWGDSLTAGTSGNIPFPTDLAQLTGFTVYNGGVGGQNSTQIEARMVANILIDTSQVATDTIDYVATDIWETLLPAPVRSSSNYSPSRYCISKSARHELRRSWLVGTNVLHPRSDLGSGSLTRH
jgi:hypothetical protein